MTISEAITAVLSASHIDDQNFRQFLRGDDPEVVAMRAALVNLADAVRDDHSNGSIANCRSVTKSERLLQTVCSAAS